MTSYLIDLVLLAALVVTALRSGRVYRELRLLRAAGSELGTALDDADRSINRAAQAVVVLKHEGIQTLRALEARIEEAREEGDRLDRRMERAEWAATRHGLADRTAA
ncbi:hypothetical protein GTW51_03470 [Aurantimonas aggregata]|uniref:Uncharacterized protein n=1 Tax=Aurantimonas aggregata TaxID=2047720 RepID=A0A6L9MDN9_9HYPH|nr:hypothetical protein [Aurantimonas aggregata]NDV85756.1 hypothetical protein [Aurantimonas aggregata]